MKKFRAHRFILKLFKDASPVSSYHTSKINKIATLSTNDVCINCRTLAMARNLLRPLVLCGPSGSGKSTLLSRLLLEHPDKFGFSVSHTTRKPRQGEVNGKHYYFTDRAAFQRAIDNGEFLETAEYNSNLYGTSRNAVLEVLKHGKVSILDIEIQGVKQVKQTDLNALMIFINPPSMEVLENRLRARNTESHQTLARRLDIAKGEIAYGLTPNNFDHVLLNDDLDRAYKELITILFDAFKFGVDSK